MPLHRASAEIVPLDRIEIRVEPWSWAFASERRGEIASHFARLQAERSGIWNGRVMLMNRYAIANGVLRGACFETDYANLCAWRDWDFADPAIYNVFAVGALRAADGAYVVGEMAPETAGAGGLFFPCGTPEPGDTVGGVLDLAGNLQRELKEETSLDIGELTVEPGWSAVLDRRYVALMKGLASPQPADALRARIMRFLGGEQRPEFVDIRIVRGPDDLSPLMPNFIVAFLEHVWRQ